MIMLSNEVSGYSLLGFSSLKKEDVAQRSEGTNVALRSTAPRPGMWIETQACCTRVSAGCREGIGSKRGSNPDAEFHMSNCLSINAISLGVLLDISCKMP